MTASIAQKCPFSARDVGDALAVFRARRPHVHCITNHVAQNFTANVLLAAGATPSMTVAEDEITAFVGMADALLVNLGTMDGERRTAIPRAIDAAETGGKPWVLDPVFVQGSPLRLTLAQELLARRPDIIRANAAEAKALGTSGEDAVLAITGAQDRVVSGSLAVRLTHGHEWMDRVTAMGCALSALLAGFAACVPDRTLAATAAIASFGLAGERAGALAAGPGTFVPLFLDQLAALESYDLAGAVHFELERFS